MSSFDEVARRSGLPDEDIRRVFRAAVTAVDPEFEDSWDWHYDSETLARLLMEEGFKE